MNVQCNVIIINREIHNQSKIEMIYHLQHLFKAGKGNTTTGR